MHDVISYPIDHSGQAIVLTSPVLDRFYRHRQMTTDIPEAGGQLFARFEDNIVQVERATGPRPSDYRKPTAFIPNRVAERREIEQCFKSGLHYIGDWHTHPEPYPVPSQIDIHSFRSMYRKSHHQLASFLMVIVGTAFCEDGLYVALCNDHGPHRLSASGDVRYWLPCGLLDMHPTGAQNLYVIASRSVRRRK